MIRVVIADDHGLIREGMRRLIESCDDMLLVGEAASGDEVLAVLRGQTGIDVLVLDITMPGPGFIEILRRVRLARPEIGVLVLSMHPEDTFAIRALQAGAAGYLTKDRSSADLTHAVRRVHAGGRYISESLAELLALEVDGRRERTAQLSEREYQVLCLLGAGHGIHEIGAKLALSPKTVSTYRFRIMEKMAFRNIADLIRYVVEKGLAV